MYQYDVRLLRQDGSLMCLIQSGCRSDDHAEVLLQGMRHIPFARAEIWRDGALIMSRGPASVRQRSFRGSGGNWAAAE
jgi:hypothetical protein